MEVADFIAEKECNTHGDEEEGRHKEIPRQKPHKENPDRDKDKGLHDLEVDPLVEGCFFPVFQPPAIHDAINPHEKNKKPY